MEEKILEVVSVLQSLSKCEVVDREVPAGLEKVWLLSFPHVTALQRRGQFSERRRADASIGLPTKGAALVRLSHQSVFPVADSLPRRSASSAVPSVP